MASNIASRDEIDIAAQPEATGEESYNGEEHINEGAEGAGDEEAELEAMKARVAEMEAEAAKLREMQAQVEREMAGPSGGSAGPSEEEKEEVDARSIYVGNVSISVLTLYNGAHQSLCPPGCNAAGPKSDRRLLRQRDYDYT